MEPAGQPEHVSAEVTPGQQPPSSASVAMRAGDRERDAVVQRLQEAFADGRLDDDEFDRRTRSALTARFNSELDLLTEDLPASTGAPLPVSSVAAARRAGRFA